MTSINYRGFDRALIEELAGMAARRIAIARFRAEDMSWSKARKASLTVQADDELKTLICEALEQGMEHKDAIHFVVENFLRSAS